MTTLAARTIQKTKPLTILQRVGNKDRTAVKDCIDAYGNFIWEVARKFTSSTKEAEALTQEIFIDIWRYAELGDQPQSDEKNLISMIALRRLIKRFPRAGRNS